MEKREPDKIPNGQEDKKKADRRKKKKIKLTIWRILQFLANPRFLLCFGLAWLITNGWCYILFGIGTCFEIGWMTAVAGAYLAFLWLPISPEKIVTVALAMGLLRLLFPNDQKTLAVLKKLYGKIKGKMRKRNRTRIIKGWRCIRQGICTDRAGQKRFGCRRDFRQRKGGSGRCIFCNSKNLALL